MAMSLTLTRNRWKSSEQVISGHTRRIGICGKRQKMRTIKFVICRSRVRLLQPAPIKSIAQCKVIGALVSFFRMRRLAKLCTFRGRHLSRSSIRASMRSVGNFGTANVKTIRRGQSIARYSPTCSIFGCTRRAPQVVPSQQLRALRPPLTRGLADTPSNSMAATHRSASPGWSGSASAETDPTRRPRTGCSTKTKPGPRLHATRQSLLAPDRLKGPQEAGSLPVPEGEP